MPQRKLTPAEKEKKKKEEAERKLKAEEEAKLRAEAEEAERIRQAQIAEEKFWEAEYEERKVRWIELPELENMWNNSLLQLKTQQSEQKKLDQWARYMRCDGSPDPTILKEINTFISLWREDKLNSSYEQIIEGTHTVYQLMEELEEILENNLDDSLTEERRRLYTETQHNLQDLLTSQLDLATHDLLCKASQMTNIDTNNLEKVIKTDLVTLAVWGNISKNPRIKSYEFGEIGVYFELPKLLTLSDIAIRILITKFDHVSYKTRSYHLKQKGGAVIEDVQAELEMMSAGEEEGEGEGDTEHDTNDVTEANTIMNTLNQLSAEETEERKDSEKVVDDEKDSEKIEDWSIPTPEPVEFEEFLDETATNAVNLRSFSVVGGVIHFNLLLLPPQPKYINNWTITQLIEPPQLRHMDYKVDQQQQQQQQLDEQQTAAATDITSAATAADQQQQQKDEERVSDNMSDITAATEGEEPLESVVSEITAAEAEPAAKKEPEKTPIAVTMKLPKEVLILEEPHLVRWCDTENRWKTDGFIDKQYSEEECTLRFKMTQFGVMALLQDAYINMPFQSWEFRSRGLNCAQFSITAAISQVEIQIKDGLVCLTQPADKPELSHLIEKWMKLPNLIKRMRYSGLNVFPELDSAKYVRVLKKNAAAEDRLYRQIGDVASAMSFSWSRWNQEIGDVNRIVVQGAEQLQDEPLTEDDWSLFLISKNRAEKLSIVETSDEYSPERAEGTIYHTNLYYTAMDLLSEQSKKRLMSTSPLFKETVYQLLRRTRVITHS